MAPEAVTRGSVTRACVTRGCPGRRLGATRRGEPRPTRLSGQRCISAGPAHRPSHTGRGTPAAAHRPCTPGGTQVHAPYTKKGKAARAAQISLLLRPALGSLAPTEAAVQPYPLGGCNPACNQTATLRSTKAATLRVTKLQPYVQPSCNPMWPQAATLRGLRLQPYVRRCTRPPSTARSTARSGTRRAPPTPSAGSPSTGSHSKHRVVAPLPA